MKKKITNLENFVYQYPTKYKEGFTDDEIKGVVAKFPKINRDKFNNALIGITCIMKGNQMVIYHCDILPALRCGLENRDISLSEWD